LSAAAPALIRTTQSLKTAKLSVAYLSSKVEHTSLMAWGVNLSSTLGVKYNKSVRNIVALPSFFNDVIVGLLLSEGYLQKDYPNWSASTFEPAGCASLRFFASFRAIVQPHFHPWTLYKF